MRGDGQKSLLSPTKYIWCNENLGQTTSAKERGNKRKIMPWWNSKRNWKENNFKTEETVFPTRWSLKSWNILTAVYWTCWSGRSNTTIRLGTVRRCAYDHHIKAFPRRAGYSCESLCDNAVAVGYFTDIAVFQKPSLGPFSDTGEQPSLFRVVAEFDLV